MSKARKAIANLVKEKGLLHAANLLGEKSTRNVSEWIKEGGRLPETKKGMIEKILRHEGLIE